MNTVEAPKNNSDIPSDSPEAGFCLAEMLVVLVIAAMLTCVFLPGLLSDLDRARDAVTYRQSETR